MTAMTALQDMLPQGWGIIGVNSALAATVACAVALLAGRLATASAPARHALLAAGLLATLLGTLASPLPSPWNWAGAWSGAPAQREPTVAATRAPDSSTSSGAISGAMHDASQSEGLSPAERSTAMNGESSSVATSSAPSAVAATNEPSEQPAAVAVGNSQSAVGARSALRRGLVAIGAVACAVWALGAFRQVAILLGSAVRLRRWLRRSRRVASPVWMTAAHNAAAAVGLRRRFAIHCIDGLPAPMVVGLWRPRVVVPQGLERLLPREVLEAVLRHELAHVARGDLWTGMLQQLARIVHWWNPLVRHVTRRLEDMREQICDDYAVAGLADSRAYAAALVEFAAGWSAHGAPATPLAVGAVSAGQLECRVRRLLSATRRGPTRLGRRGALGVSSVLAVTALLLVVLRWGSYRGTAAEPPPSPAPALGASPAAPETEDRQEGERPSLEELVQRFAEHERASLPYQMDVRVTLRPGDRLTPEERSKLPWADGRLHERRMEYAMLAKRVWRTSETHFIDGEFVQGPYVNVCDTDRKVQFQGDSPQRNGFHVTRRPEDLFPFPFADPVHGVFCLSDYGAAEFLSEAYPDKLRDLELHWDGDDAQLTFAYVRQRFDVWLSRAHNWYPLRVRRYWKTDDTLFHDEWEATRLVRDDGHWRVVAGERRYRLSAATDERIAYVSAFEVVKAAYGDAVDRGQFHVELPDDVQPPQDKPRPPAPPKPTREITVRAIGVDGEPIAGAVVRLPAGAEQDHDVVTTDADGMARSPKAPPGDVTVRLAAEGRRPALWILGDSKLTAVLAPETSGACVDEEGQGVAGAWIPNRPITFRADGIVPDASWMRGQDQADDRGNFLLTSELTLRRPDGTVVLVAVDPRRERMAILRLPVAELGNPQQLVLRKLHRVRGSCLFQGLTELRRIDPLLTTEQGEPIGDVMVRREATPEGVRADFELWLPPGRYVLVERRASDHAGFQIPFELTEGQDTLELGTRAIAPEGLSALRGRPAPELDVVARDGQPASLASLRGKIVVLDFWGTWCRPCVTGMPALMEVAGQFRERPVAWLSIHTPELETLGELDKRLAEHAQRDWGGRELPFTTMLDRPSDEAPRQGSTAARYGVAEWPTLVVIDSQGRVVGPVSPDKLAATLTRLLGE